MFQNEGLGVHWQQLKDPAIGLERLDDIDDGRVADSKVLCNLVGRLVVELKLVNDVDPLAG